MTPEGRSSRMDEGLAWGRGSFRKSDVHATKVTMPLASGIPLAYYAKLNFEVIPIGTAESSDVHVGRHFYTRVDPNVT